jgi:hypothetical protein
MYGEDAAGAYIEHSSVFRLSSSPPQQPLTRLLIATIEQTIGLRAFCMRYARRHADACFAS